MTSTSTVTNLSYLYYTYSMIKEKSLSITIENGYPEIKANKQQDGQAGKNSKGGCNNNGSR